MIFGLLVVSLCVLFVFALAWGVIALVILVDGARVDVPFVPTRNHALEPILHALELAPGDVLYDLGCGDAKVLAAAHQRVPAVRCVGVEKGIIPYCIARLRVREGIEVRFGDLSKADISGATRLYVYLHPRVLASIEEKVFSEMPQGARIVSCSFEFPNHRPIVHIPLEANDSLAKELFIYTVS